MTAERNESARRVTICQTTERCPMADSFRRSFFVFLLFTTALAQFAAAQPANEPIAYVGHGAMFDAKGQEIPPSLAFIRATEAWYRATLLARVSQEQHTQFQSLEKSAAALAADDQGRLVVAAYLLDWLADRVKLDDGRRLRSKLNVLKFDLAEKGPEGPASVNAPRSTARFTLPKDLVDRLRVLGIISAPLNLTTT